MTAADIADFRATRPDEDRGALQRFVFNDVDWAFYKQVNDRVNDRRTFVTFYKGRLEVVTTSLLHETISKLLSIMIWVLAEELNISMMSAGRATLRQEELELGTEPDESFYIAHEPLMRGRAEINLPADPPPDLAIEVEVTRRLGVRRSVYQNFNVPEIWVFGPNGLEALLLEGNQYIAAEQSPTFKLLSLAEMTSFVREGLSQDQTTFTKAFRRRVQEVIAKSRP